MYSRTNRSAPNDSTLQPLPSERFAYCTFVHAAVNIDYHVEYDDHFYSVPYQLCHEEPPFVELRVTTGTIEVLHKNRRVASHARSYVKHEKTTLPDHMPEAHRQHIEWTPSLLVS